MQSASKNFIRELKKQKRNSCLLFLDNIKIIKEALKVGVKPKYILIQNDKVDEFEKIFQDYQAIIYTTTHIAIEMLSDNKTPQGVVCITEYLPNMVIEPKSDFLVIDGLQDPGNVGTLIRTACACGIKYVYLVESVNVTNTKLIRSSVGTIFQTRVMETSKEEFIELVKKYNLPLIKADMYGKNIFTFNLSGTKGIVIGNEGHGVSQELSSLCKYSVALPMKNNVESLNASIAGSIIMYELHKDEF